MIGLRILPRSHRVPSFRFQVSFRFSVDCVAPPRSSLQPGISLLFLFIAFSIIVQNNILLKFVTNIHSSHPNVNCYIGHLGFVLKLSRYMCAFKKDGFQYQEDGVKIEI